ncbi:TFIIS-type domain-containing protein [Psidium guajava]|nr:TFIIS-type domain-containing protein [Psidium guajava]
MHNLKPSRRFPFPLNYFALPFPLPPSLSSLLTVNFFSFRTSSSVISVNQSAKTRSDQRCPNSLRMSTMKFCCECNNILYPKEDREQKILLFACRNCEHQEVADNYCVYRNEIHHSVGERTQVLQDVAADPTLPRTKSVRCAQCNHGEAVFFQATARGEEGMTLFFVCCNPNCGYRWRD